MQHLCARDEHGCLLANRIFLRRAVYQSSHPRSSAGRTLATLYCEASSSSVSASCFSAWQARRRTRRGCCGSAMADQTRSKLGQLYPRAEIESSQAAYMKELRAMYSKTGCADCGANPANWATLKRPAFVCINCAQNLRADATNRVKNCIGTYLWHPDEMDVMRSLKK